MVAGLFLIPLVYVMGLMSRWQSIEREVGLGLLETAVAAFVVTFLLPVMRRGGRWQSVFAMLLLIIPAVALLDAVLMGLGSASGFNL